MDSTNKVVCGLIVFVVIFSAYVLVFRDSTVTDLNFCHAHNFTTVTYVNFGDIYCSKIDADGKTIMQKIVTSGGKWYFVHEGETVKIPISGG